MTSFKDLNVGDMFIWTADDEWDVCLVLGILPYEDDIFNFLDVKLLVAYKDGKHEVENAKIALNAYVNSHYMLIVYDQEKKHCV